MSTLRIIAAAFIIAMSAANYAIADELGISSLDPAAETQADAK